MPGNYQLSIDTLVDEVGTATELGIKAFIFFGIPPHKDPEGRVRQRRRDRTASVAGSNKI